MRVVFFSFCDERFEPVLFQTNTSISKTQPFITCLSRAEIAAASRQCRTGTNESHRRAFANVFFDNLRRSVDEPPSVITISSGGRVCVSKLSSSSRIESSSSRTGMTTLTFICHKEFSHKGTKEQRKTQRDQPVPLRLCVNVFFLHSLHSADPYSTRRSPTRGNPSRFA